MAIGAARVMAAGKAGLESLPYFVDELMAQGIEQLAPWAIDHSQGDIDILASRTQPRLEASWKSIFEIGSSPPGTAIDTATSGNRRLLTLINPRATEDGNDQLPNNPAQIGAWCRRQIAQYCRETENMWERFKTANGLTSAYQLAVIIPYCPEGPTSGTVGMYLGAALRDHFAQKDMSSEVVVWGIELCPPIARDGFDNMNEADVENAFRGYVAREEILKGVPLSPTDPFDSDLRQPFDINIVFDGGAASLSDTSDETVWGALDRAAAQTTACLINGASSGDYAEAMAQLRQGRRWNAHLLHVVSERSYGETCRYLSYQVTLPWHRDREYWDDAPLQERKDAFISRIDHDIKSRLEHEQNEAVKSHVARLVDKAEDLREVSLRGGAVNWITGKTKEAINKAEGLLRDAIREDEENYRDALERDPHPTRNIPIPKGDLFSINLVLPEEQRRRAALIARDNGAPARIGEILGAAGVSDVRNRLTGLLSDVLKHPHCDAVRDDSDAFFEALLSIAVNDAAVPSNEGLRPTRENLSYYIAADSRNINGRYGEWDHDLSKFVSLQRSNDGSQPSPLVAFQWKPDGVAYDVPVEYSILTLARVRSSEGFKDISTYEKLENNYQNLAKNQSNLIQFARYYGVKPPPELLPDGTDDAIDVSPTANPSVNGQPATIDVVRDSA